MAKKVDSKVLDLINEVKKRKAEIVQAERPQYKTNLAFSYEEGSSKTINLQVESNINNLIKIAGFIQQKHTEFEKGLYFLVGSGYAFSWNGFSQEEWLSDIKTRINKLSIADKRKKLEVLEQRLNAVISPELRAQMEIDAISSELA